MSKYNTSCVNANTSIRDPHSHRGKFQMMMTAALSISIATFPQTVQRFAILYMRFPFSHFVLLCRPDSAVVRQPEKLVSEAYVTGSAINTRDSKAQPMSRELPMFKNRSLLQRTCCKLT